jgi:hypothetical protein
MDNLNVPEPKTESKKTKLDGKEMVKKMSLMSKNKNVSSISTNTAATNVGIRKPRRTNGEEEIIVRTENTIIMTGLNELYAKTDQSFINNPPLSDIECPQKDGTYKDTGPYKPYGEF